MESKHFHHALQIDEKACTGCSHCMDVCPTEAIRVRAGKAVIFENRCVDCGECYKACPVKAIFIEQDDFNRIQSFKYRIALVPAVFMGQFPKRVTSKKIHDAILTAGFTHVVEVESSTSLLREEMIRYMELATDTRPLISSFCPAIIRLIQVRFPALTNHIVLLKPPLDITALFARKQLSDSGINPSEIGVFYITPCAAKIAAIKSPVGEDYSMITGVINMDYLYNRVYKIIHTLPDEQREPQRFPSLPKTALQWSLTNGEAGCLPGRCLAIDEIHNVIEFLEKTETTEFNKIDFLELRACDQSCSGGVLISANRFIVTERLKSSDLTIVDDTTGFPGAIKNYENYLKRRISIQKITPRSMLMLDENLEVAMTKMDQAMEIMKLLPSVDCGICGSPNCPAFANDIVSGIADIRQCIFIQKSREKTGELSPEQSTQLLKNIWGHDKC